MLPNARRASEAQKTVTKSEDDGKLRACRGSVSERTSFGRNVEGSSQAKGIEPP